MNVPQKLIDEMMSARDALDHAQGQDGQAAQSAAAAATAADQAGKDRDAALAAHQEANKLAQQALADIADYLEGNTQPQPPSAGEEEQAPASSPADRPEKVAGGSTMRKAR